MTNREAIEVIKLVQAQVEWEYPMDYAAAFDMAISALQVQDLQPTCNQLATDTISRQSAIDVEGLDEQIRCEMCRNPMHTDRGCDGNCKYDEKLYERIMQILGARIKPLSSAQPDNRLTEIADLVEGTIDHFDLNDAMDLLYQIKEVLKHG